MRRPPEVALVIAALAFSQGCGSCVEDSHDPARPIGSIAPGGEKYQTTTVSDQTVHVRDAASLGNME